MPRWPKRTFAERFWSKVNKGGPDECWLWTASCFKSGGYGAFMGEKNHLLRANVVAYELTHAVKVAKGIEICHSCDNPPCCNPAHLFEGTRKVNHADMMSKGRYKKGRIDYGPDNGNSKLTWAQVNEMRRLVRSGAKTRKQAAEIFKVSHSLAVQIVREVIWKPEHEPH